MCAFQPRSAIPAVAELLFPPMALNFDLWPWPSNLTQMVSV